MRTMTSSAHEKTFFVTGFPGFIGKRLVRALSTRYPNARIFALTESRFLKDAERIVERLQNPRVTVITGNIVDMHLGLSGEEYQTLCTSVTHIFHLAAVSNLGIARDVAWKVNVEGTRNVLELARDCNQLQRLSHFSTCFVSGDRVGVIAEDELDAGQSFRNVYEESKAEAERLLRRAAERLPITIYRPASVVGDSRTGEIDRFDGPYYLGILLVMSPLVIPLPLPGNGVAPLNVVPVDFVVEASVSMADNPRAIGRTVHLVDPNPMSARRVYELIAQMAQKRLPRFNLSAKAADVVLRLPGIEKISRPQRAAITYVNHLAIYNCHNTLELLDGTGIRCPPLATYLDKLVTYVKAHYRSQKPLPSDTDDPLDISLQVP